jgi:hypothetical protein
MDAASCANGAPRLAVEIRRFFTAALSQRAAVADVFTRSIRASLSRERCIVERVRSGRSTLNEDQIAERGARMARRDDREYREYLREEQRRQPGCPAREVDQRGRATR